MAAYALAGDEKFNRFFWSVSLIYYANIAGFLGTEEHRQYDKEFQEVGKAMDDPVKKQEVPFLIFGIWRKLLYRANRLGFQVPMSTRKKGAVRLAK